VVDSETRFRLPEVVAALAHAEVFIGRQELRRKVSAL
jgi:hypothetical protein